MALPVLVILVEVALSMLLVRVDSVVVILELATGLPLMETNDTDEELVGLIEVRLLSMLLVVVLMATGELVGTDSVVFDVDNRAVTGATKAGFGTAV